MCAGCRRHPEADPTCVCCCGTGGVRVEEIHRVTELVCLLRNTGQTHATLGAGSLTHETGQNMPSRPDSVNLPQTREGPFTIAARETLEDVFPFTPYEWNEACPPLRSNDALYFYGSISETDACNNCITFFAASIANIQR